MAWRRKARSVAAGDWRFKADVLGALIGVSDIRKTIGRGDGGTGTLVGIVDSTGALHTYGCCTSVQAWAATGVIYGTGDYATEASRNSTTAGATQISTGYSVTIAGVTTNGSATAEAHTAGQVISTAGGSYDVSNVAPGNIKDGVSIGGVTGNFVGLGGTVQMIGLKVV